MSWTVAGVVRRWAEEAPERPALTYGEETLSWSELHDQVSQVANALVAEGVEAGDRVAILDKNTAPHFLLLFGAASMGAVYVAVNWRLAPPEIAQIVNDAQTKVLVVGDEFVGQLHAIEDQLTTVRRILVAGGSSGSTKHISFAAWRDAQPTDDPGVVCGDGDVAVQLYTSGTTGLPKGVMLTNGNLGSAMPAGGPELGIGPESVSMVAMPLFHIGGTGWALLGMTHGAHTVLQREVDPAAILETIGRRRITHAFLVPAVLMFLLMVPGVEDTDFSSLDLILYGASPISEDILVKCITVMDCRFAEVYGLTETTGAITILRPDQHDPNGLDTTRLRSCGVPYDNVEIRIASPEDDSECAVGEVGEIWIRSPQNMLGYWGKPAETAAVLRGDGWLRTGDAGFVDEGGFLFLHDRIKDMIVSGGENIYPAEVENALMSHPSVVDTAVIGVPSDRWGETVKAVVVLAAGAQTNAEELIEHCRERLARYKCPTSVDFVESLPRNPSGKILKRELREPYWVGHERRVN